MELPCPGDETRDETELEKRVWPLAEKRDTAGETGVEEVVVVQGDGGRRDEGDDSAMVSKLSRRLVSRNWEGFNMVGETGLLARSGWR